MPSVKNIVRALIHPSFAKKALMRRCPGVVHVGNRSHGRKLTGKGVQQFKKTYSDKNALQMELKAFELFERFHWMAPLLDSGSDYIVVPFIEESCRLDVAAAQADQQTKNEMARQAVGILLDMYSCGYAHRDFHAKNLFWVDGVMYAIDFELIAQYPQNSQPAFSESYDMTGCGMDSPHETMNMCWGADVPSGMALATVLGVSTDRALEMAGEFIREQLLDASLSFNKQGKRHTCQSGKIYSSFELPQFAVPHGSAQRNSQRRYEHFNISGDDFAGAKILDLGCNAGAMLFNAQQYSPGKCVGVEYDKAKVDVATKIARYCGLNNVSFMQADIDLLETASLDGPFDIVYCLAIEAHVKKPDRLYKLLGEVCSSTLIFEGNSTTNMDVAAEKLHAAGFVDIETLGVCDDDKVSANNARGLIKATK